MTPFLWIALALLLLNAVPALVSFALYLGSGSAVWLERALRFYRWSVLVVLTTFNITIFKHIIVTIINW